MKRNLKWSAFVSIATLLILSALATAVIYMKEAKTEDFEMDCRFAGIEYANVEPNACWMEDVSSEFCPLPTEIECHVKGALPTSLIKEVMQRR